MPIEKPYSATYRFLLCKVAIGRSLTVPVSSISKEQPLLTKKDLDSSFDSIYLKNEHSQEESFSYNYVVFDNNQVKPEYIVDFTFDESREANLKIPNCDEKDCGDIATIYCINDDANLCARCSEELHDRGGAIARKHKTVSFDEKPK